VKISKHCHDRITERLGVTAENLHERIVADMEELGGRRYVDGAEVIVFGDCAVICRGSTAVTFIRGKHGKEKANRHTKQTREGYNANPI